MKRKIITIDESLWAEKRRFAAHRLFGEQGENQYSLGENKE